MTIGLSRECGESVTKRPDVVGGSTMTHETISKPIHIKQLPPGIAKQRKGGPEGEGKQRVVYRKRI